VSGEKPTVVRNDTFKIEEIEEYDAIVFSPGPGLPSEAGLMMEVLKQYEKSKKILGVCLGHQAIAEHFGSSLKQLNSVKHGVASDMLIKNFSGIYKGIPRNIEVGRYHSWCVDEKQLSSDLLVTAVTKDEQIMSFKHKELPIYGVQYHPESVLTPYGLKIIENFLMI
jgi:anthranilate synthase component 2